MSENEGVGAGDPQCVRHFHDAEIAADADRVVAAWGSHGDLHGRGREVAELLDGELVALDTTKDGQPNHPLYQPADAEPTAYTAAEVA